MARESLGACNVPPVSLQVPMNRFRPNIVVDGIEAWEEDRYVVGLRRSRAALAVLLSGFLF
jgi:uncharacterized protein YcbX